MAFVTITHNTFFLFLLSLLCLIFSFTPILAYQPELKRGLQSQHQCDIQQLHASEPTRRLKAEAGVVEFWEQNDEQFRCTGVAVVRHVIEPKGLLLPSYTNVPYITYVTQGSGIQGVIVPGCPETFESPGGARRGSKTSESDEQHQRVFRIQEGDVIGSPPGVVQWTYNDGVTPIVSVTLLDLTNPLNQLDHLNFRSFYLGGNPKGQESQDQGTRAIAGGRNIFHGFDDELLANALNMDDMETIRSLKGDNDDNRGCIVRVETELEFLSPKEDEQEIKRKRSSFIIDNNNNGLDETLCCLSFKHNIDQPLGVDVFNKHGGWINTLNGHKFPLLKLLRFSAEKGVLYKNAMMTPHWTMNAHSIIYITRGTGRVQVAGDNGQLVYDGKVQEGQLLVVPQNFVVVKKAEQEGLAWVAFKTNDNAMISPLVGRMSAIRGIPEEVLMNSYDMSRDEVRRLKYGRDEARVFSARTRMD